MAINVLLFLLFLSVVGLAATSYTKYTGRTLKGSFYEKKAVEYTIPVLKKITSSCKHMIKMIQPYLDTVNQQLSYVLQNASSFQERTETKQEL